MFEDSLVESRVFEVSSSKRWTALASIGLQVAIAGMVIAVPLFHPEALPFHLDAPRVMVPLLPKAPAVVERVSSVSSSSASAAVPSVTRALIFSHSPGGGDVSETPSLAPVGGGMGMGDGLPSGIGVGDGPRVSVVSAKAPAAPLHVSTGVLQGMLIAPIRPVYPAIAKAAHVEGSVVVEAVISRAGTIESLHVVSGPMMLQGAAMDAIREARYQPYRLNGEPTEVQTVITVNFRMGG
jgi:periplasmic protein TonB